MRTRKKGTLIIHVHVKTCAVFAIDREREREREIGGLTLASTNARGRHHNIYKVRTREPAVLPRVTK